MSDGPTSFFIVDDHDIQSIDYKTKNLWFQLLVDDNTENDAYDGTVTDGITGAQASFSFQGTAIAVSGYATTLLNVSAPTVQFSIDGKVVQTTTAPNNGTKDFPFYFLDYESLDGTVQHTLDINVLNATADYPFVLDYLIYSPPAGASPTASQSIITTFLPQASSTSSSSSGSSSSGSSGAPVGAIVGGVIGGVAVIVASILAIWFLCFRRKSNGKPYFYATAGKPAELLYLDDEAKPTPYERGAPSVAPSSTVGQAIAPQPSSYTGSQYTAPSGLGYHTQSAYDASEPPQSDYSSSAGPSGAALSLASGSVQRVTASPNQPRSKAAEAGLLSVPQEATFHADSGIRFNENGEASGSALPQHVLTDVPPSYSAS